MKSKTDAIIIGGGIIGLACAHYLIKKNISVKIIEQNYIGSGASHGNCGLLHFSGIIPLCSPGVVRHEIDRTICANSPLSIKPTLDMTLIKWLLKFTARHNQDKSRDKNALMNFSNHCLFYII